MRVVLYRVLATLVLAGVVLLWLDARARRGNQVVPRPVVRRNNSADKLRKGQLTMGEGSRSTTGPAQLSRWCAATVSYTHLTLPTIYSV